MLNHFKYFVNTILMQLSMNSTAVFVCALFFFFTFSTTLLLYENLNKCSSEENTIHTSNIKSLSKPKHFLIILILSSPWNHNRRNVLRNTWLQFCKDESIKYFFVIGMKSMDQSIKEKIVGEQSKFSDILNIENVADTYSELASKTLEAFVWINDNFNFKYALKCDDDSFVNVLDLIKLLEEYKDDVKQLYLGFFNGHATVQKYGKWKENNWILCDFYLPYALGGGYVLDRGLISFISQNSEDLELFVSEDVSVGVWLASKRNINRVHSNRFNTEFISRGCSNSYVVSHKHTDSDFKKLYDNLTKNGRLCSKEFQIRLSYNYNWTVPPSKCCHRSEQLP